MAEVFEIDNARIELERRCIELQQMLLRNKERSLNDFTSFDQFEMVDSQLAPLRMYSIA